MKKFESCLYVPQGFARAIQPVTNSDLQHLTVDLLNKTSLNEFKLGCVEIDAQEIVRVFAKEEFSYYETLYRVLLPITSNMTAETAITTENGDQGWERIRNTTIRRVMEFDSTIKLWDVNRRLHPLYQKLPHSIMHDGRSNYHFILRRLDIPTDLSEARKEFRNLTKSGSSSRLRAGAENILTNWNHNELIRKRLLRCLKIASNVVPKMATCSPKFTKMVRHSLKTELLKDVEMNAHNMGMTTDCEEPEFSFCIRHFQEPTEKFLPMNFTTTYKTSLYAVLPKAVSPAVIYDFDYGKIGKKDNAIEMNFMVQNLVTAWPRRFDKVHDMTHETPIKDVLPETCNSTKVNIMHSDSVIAKLIRKPDETQYPMTVPSVNWTGKRSFREITINPKGLKMRKNAVSDPNT